jgi:EAL domain-containing protein (putative c-di-GMP-specific phosphodiesterase class I)/GAF domain-containing protein
MSEKLERPEEHEAPSATASDLSRGPASPHSDPPIPIGEAARLADLYATELLDTEPEEAYDAIARTAAYIANAPAALITLVDEHHQRTKACIGIESGNLDRRDAFCSYAILEPAHTLLVPDATLDERFRDNPFVTGEPHLRFYCGTPIVSAAGRALGTVCVVDREPRELAPAQVEALEDLARQASALIQSRARIRELEQTMSSDEAAHVVTLQVIGNLTMRATDLDTLLQEALTSIVETLELGAGGLWWHDGDQLAVDALWIDATGLLAGAELARRNLAYPADLMIHTHETATRHGDDVLPTVVAAALSAADIHASYAVPITVAGTIVGAFELIPHPAGEPSARRLLAATQAAAEIGRWIERDRTPAWLQALTTSTSHEAPDIRPEQLRRRGAMKSRLAGAAERGELSVVHQPIVDLGTDSTTGVEALARWCDPDLGDIAPSEFIPLAEESGAIREIGTFVRRQALHDLPELAAASARPDDFALWLNVSARELDEDYAAAVLADLAEAGVEPRRLTLEVTERLALTGDNPAAKPLFMLAAHGVGIAIDDFGTGFTSLAQLRSLPLSQLKIDRSFVADLTTVHAERVRPIIRGIVQLGHSLDLTVVTEGIETPDQLAIVTALGADLAQGHLFGDYAPGR